MRRAPTSVSGPTEAPAASDASSIIALHRATLRGRELAYVRDALGSGRIGGGGEYTKRAETSVEGLLRAPKVLLTHSCTGALEIAALLAVKPGDEVILPSFTFAAAATAFARCGAKLVFVDIDPTTLNIDPHAVQAAITSRTRAIVAMHYGGVSCDILKLAEIAAAANCVLIEDAAHCIGAKYRDRPLGTFGALSTLSFNETKNVTSGEGGALVINDRTLIERAQTIRDRGTNRDQFIRGQVKEYEWKDLGSAYAPSEITAALLLAQLEQVEAITATRVQLWQRYHSAFEALERAGYARRPIVPLDAAHNGHIYYLLLGDVSRRPAFLEEVSTFGISAAFHYVPLHTAPAGRKYGRAAGSLAVTEDVAGRLVRLPLHLSMNEGDQSHVVDVVLRALSP